MIAQLLSFISENDHDSLWQVVGRYFVAFFAFLYKLWFAILIKISALFINENYLIKAGVSVLCFIITAYTIFYIIKKIINLSLKLTWMSALKILKSVFFRSSKEIKNLKETDRNNKPEGSAIDKIY